MSTQAIHVREGAGQAPERRVEFELTLGYSYSGSGRCWFKRYIVKAWVKEGGRYVAASPSAVVKTLDRDWHVSCTKRYAHMRLAAPEGTIIKVFDTRRMVYYLVSSRADGGLVELKHESVGVDVIEAPKVRVRYFKNIVHLPDGSAIEDVDEDPKLYVYTRWSNLPLTTSLLLLKEGWRLSDLERLKEALRIARLLDDGASPTG